MAAEKNMKENNGDETNDDPPEPIIKSVVSINKTESNTSSKDSVPQETDDLSSDIKSNTVPEKKVQLRTAKTIIRSIIESDRSTSTLFTETVPKKVVRKIVVESNENNSSQKSDIALKETSEEAVNISSAAAPKQITSDVSAIKIKTLEEIRKEKQDRKAKLNQQLETEDKNYADSTSVIANEQVGLTNDSQKKSANVKPLKGRKISIKKKDDGTAKTNVIKSEGNLLLKRKVGKVKQNTVMENGRPD